MGAVICATDNMGAFLAFFEIIFGTLAVNFIVPDGTGTCSDWREDLGICKWKAHFTAKYHCCTLCDFPVTECAPFAVVDVLYSSFDFCIRLLGCIPNIYRIDWLSVTNSPTSILAERIRQIALALIEIEASFAHCTSLSICTLQAIRRAILASAIICRKVPGFTLGAFLLILTL